MSPERRAAPLLQLNAAVWFNLRAIVDHSATAALAAPGERAALASFLAEHGAVLPPVQARDEAADPMVKLRGFLARPRGIGASRFSDGSFPIVYMGDDPETCLAEVAHHLGRALGETGAAKVKTHYFLLARFVVTGEALDVRKGFPALHRPGDWVPAQAFGRRAASEGRHGIAFRAVRRKGADNLGILRKDPVRSGIRVRVIGLRWDGSGVVQV